MAKTEKTEEGVKTTSLYAFPREDMVIEAENVEEATKILLSKLSTV